MKPLSNIPFLTVVLGTAVLAGCASTPEEPTVADRMRSHAADVQQEVDLKSSLAQQWERGKELSAKGSDRVQKGERRMRDAEREMERAREQIELGQSEISEGDKLVEDAEQRFSEKYPGMKLR